MQEVKSYLGTNSEENLIVHEAFFTIQPIKGSFWPISEAKVTINFLFLTDSNLFLIKRPNSVVGQELMRFASLIVTFSSLCFLSSGHWAE